MGQDSRLATRPTQEIDRPNYELSGIACQWTQTIGDRRPKIGKGMSCAVHRWCLSDRIVAPRRRVRDLVGLPDASGGDFDRIEDGGTLSRWMPPPISSASTTTVRLRRTRR